MRKQLLSWQWGLYPQNHTTRANLVIHIFTTPLFIAGTLTLLSSPMYGVRSAVSGLVGMIIPMALQGRGHKGEAVTPVPFLGPMDFVSRFFCEQFINFPRYVLSGGWAKAFRQARS
ncbi:MAG TPA: terminase [Myxococcaceae bacterium]|jgi:hypothetical protein